jgi:hypothetical protein
LSTEPLASVTEACGVRHCLAARSVSAVRARRVRVAAR